MLVALVVSVYPTVTKLPVEKSGFKSIYKELVDQDYQNEIIYAYDQSIPTVQYYLNHISNSGSAIEYFNPEKKFFLEIKKPFWVIFDHSRQAKRMLFFQENNLTIMKKEERLRTGIYRVIFNK